LEKEFAEADVDGNGYISKDELRDFLAKKVAKANPNVDLNVMGLEYDELVESIFMTMNREVDAPVEFQEFID
jgi:Ca2+-binding EF-hand superfamily protein